MLRSLSLLLITLPIWAQFQPASEQPPYYPQQPPQQQQQQPQYPQYPAAQQQPQPQDQEGRDWATDQQHGVARLRIVQGDVNVKRGDNGVLTGAIMNAPLMTHDHLETGPGSRAEIELDAANVVRLAPDSDLGIANLAYGRAQLQLGIGTIIMRVLRDSQAQVEIDTPSVAFHPLSQGDYRISVFDNGTSTVTVHAGRLEMSGPRGTQVIEQGQAVMVRGDAADPEFQQTAPAPHDQFDDWSITRDSEMLSARSYQYVDPNVYGAEDLDRYGSWVPSQYGQVWAPQGVGPDWSPYSNGQWTYADYYGWTWVGYEPWGWAPYHYGNWFWNTGVGWCWWPGARGGFGFRWSPAMVSFFGFGGGLGWVALAPFEHFHPWWGRGYGVYGGFGVYDIHGFRNAGIRGGAITAGYNSFAGAGHRYSVATAGQLRGASMFHGSIPVSASASSYRFNERAVTANPRLSQAASRQFYSRPGGSFNQSRYASGGGTYNNARPSYSINNGSGGGGGGGWQRFGSPAPRQQQQQQQQRAPQQGFSSSYRPSAGGSAESGWHSFGQPQQSAPRYTPPRTIYGGGSPNYRAPAAPSYRAPAAPSYRAPAAPHYNAPKAQAAPHYSAPKGGGGGGSHFGGGGGGHAGGGGGHHR